MSDEKYTFEDPQFLVGELERAYSSLNNHYSLLVQLFALAGTVVGGLILYVFMANEPPSMVLIFVPMPVISIIGVAIVLYYQVEAHIYYLRFVARYLSDKLPGSETLLYYGSGSFPSRFLSLHSGDKSYRAISFGLVLLLLFLYMGLTVSVFDIIYRIRHNHLLGTTYLTMMLVAFLWVGAGVAGMLRSAPKAYERFVVANANVAIATPDSQLGYTSESFVSLILPRPMDFLFKSIMFLSGAIIAALEGNVSLRPHLQEMLFAPATMPAYVGVIAYTLIWFAIQEGLIQQAKYLWNDIRDQQRDKLIPGNETRLPSKNPPGIAIYLSLGLRLLSGTVLAYFVSVELFVLCIAILILQAIYELWAKSRSAQYPFAPLFIVSIGALIRLFGGALAIGWSVTSYRLWLYGIVFFAIGVTYIASLWKIEADYMNHNTIKFQRGQNEYFQLKGTTWITASSIIGVLVCCMLFISVLFPVFDQEVFATDLPSYLTTTIILILVSAFGCSVCAIAFAVISFTESVKRKVNQFYDKSIRSRLAVRLNGLATSLRSHHLYISRKRLFRALLRLTVMGVIAVPCFVPMPPKGVISLISLASVLIFYQVFTNISFEEYKLLHLKKNFRILIYAIYIYIFNANSGLKLQHLLYLIVSLNSATFANLVDEHLHDTNRTGHIEK